MQRLEDIRARIRHEIEVFSIYFGFSNSRDKFIKIIERLEHILLYENTDKFFLELFILANRERFFFTVLEEIIYKDEKLKLKYCKYIIKYLRSENLDLIQMFEY